MLIIGETPIISIIILQISFSQFNSNLSFFLDLRIRNQMVYLNDIL